VFVEENTQLYRATTASAAMDDIHSFKRRATTADAVSSELLFEVIQYRNWQVFGQLVQDCQLTQEQLDRSLYNIVALRVSTRSAQMMQILIEMGANPLNSYVLESIFFYKCSRRFDLLHLSQLLGDENDLLFQLKQVLIPDLVQIVLNYYYTNRSQSLFQARVRDYHLDSAELMLRIRVHLEKSAFERNSSTIPKYRAALASR